MINPAPFPLTMDNGYELLAEAVVAGVVLGVALLLLSLLAKGGE